VNSRFVLEYLEQEKIPVIAKDLNGDHGRVIHFVSPDYSVFVKRIAKAKSIDVGRKEKQYWKKSIDQHENDSSQTAVHFL
jgi:chemotaxis protein CheD